METDSKARGEVLYPMLMQDNSICKFQHTAFLKLGSHYPSLRGIVQLTNSATPIVTFRLFAFGI